MLDTRTFRRLFDSVLHPRKSRRSPSIFSKSSEEDETSFGLSELPPEIWLHILRFATYSNPPVDESSSEAVSFLSVDHSRSSVTLRLNHYRKCQKRKTQLARVCKVWNDIMQEVIWESIWISRSREASILARRLEGSDPFKGHGRFIRRLQIETPSLEKCSPDDIRIILDHCPRLIVFSDYRSVRRVPVEGCDESLSTPEKLFEALTHPDNHIQRLSWTNYDDFSMHLRLSPMFQTTATRLSFLELNFCFPETYSRPLLSEEILTLDLPKLRSLKCTLDNSTLAVLSRWTMPLLVNLSILSADFSYWSSGFADFFLAHGDKIRMLELVHSSTLVEEHSINMRDKKPIPLAEWCPNLKSFICSADAEWDWSNPNWIAPHVLLPSHPTVEFIGIRDVHRRLIGDMDTLGHAHHAVFFRLLTQVSSLLNREAFPCLRYLRDMSWESDILRRGGGCFATPPPPPPKITKSRYGFKRPSWNPLPHYSTPSPSPYTPSPQPASTSTSDVKVDEKYELTAQTKRLLEFWEEVIRHCGESGVWLEDFRGYNIRVKDLMRVTHGLISPNPEEFFALDVMGCF